MIGRRVILAMMSLSLLGAASHKSFMVMLINWIKKGV